jgi:pimeloyl-ACP methyl ester carboxylesterase
MSNPDPAGTPEIRSFASQGLTLRYADWGNAAAPPLLLIHGTRDHARSWDAVASALADRFHVMALDLRGHGDSDWSPDGAYLLPYHVLDLIEMVETLGQPQVAIIAHSYGGNVAARYAGMFPDRVSKIVFVDSLGPGPDNYARWEREGQVARSRDWTAQRRDPGQNTTRILPSIAAAAARMAKANPRLSPKQLVHLATHGVRRHGAGFTWKFDPRVSMFLPEDFAVQGSHYWREITAPALLLYGRQSWTTDPVQDGRAAFFRNATCLTFERSGHWIHHDQFEDFMAALEKFL